MSLGMDASGEWRKSLHAKGNVLRGRKYTEQLQYGRKPNKDQDPKALKKWAYGMAMFNPSFKNWLEIRGLTQYGIQIAYKIAENGTTWYQQGGTDLMDVLESREVIEYINERMSVHIKAEVQLYVKSMLNENFKK